MVQQVPLGRIAMSLVHEAMHGRLCAWGIGYSPRLWARVEEVCVREEADFVKQLPDNDLLVAYAESKLSSVWWDDEKLHRRRLQQLAAYGWPEWSRSITTGSSGHPFLNLGSDLGVGTKEVTEKSPDDRSERNGLNLGVWAGRFHGSSIRTSVAN